MKKLYVGVDLAITGRHRASVYDFVGSKNPSDVGMALTS